MRRSRLLVALTVTALCAGVLFTPSAFAKSRPDMTVSSLAEPPDGASAGGKFQESYTVSNQGTKRSSKRTTVRFYLTRAQNNPRKTDFRLTANISKTVIRALSARNELARRLTLRIPSTVPNGLYYLAACIDKTKKIKESSEKNNCRTTGQVVAIPAGVGGVVQQSNEGRIARFSLAIGRPTLPGVIDSVNNGSGSIFGDAEKSNVRRTIATVGPVQVVADCKRTSNGDQAGPNAAPTSANDFDEDGDEAKILIYSTSGSVSFNGPGQSSRKNIPAGQGAPQSDDTPRFSGGPATQLLERTGGEGKHMAIAAARDPQQTAPEDDWGFSFKVGSIYVNHDNGTEFILTAYAGIDVLGVGDRCVFGGLIKVLKRG